MAVTVAVADVGWRILRRWIRVWRITIRIGLPITK